MTVFRLAALLLVVGNFLAHAQGRDPLTGAWEMTGSKNLTTGAVQELPKPPLRVIYADGHYVQFTANAGRQKLTIPNAEMTKEQLLDRLRMQGQYGTYVIKGNTVTRRSIAAANPNNEGQDNGWDFRVDGDTLIMTRTDSQKQTIENRYRRLRGGT